MTNDRTEEEKWLIWNVGNLEYLAEINTTLLDIKHLLTCILDEIKMDIKE